MPTTTAGFALRLLERLGAGGVVFSPMSIHRALMAVRPGVTGAAAAALDEVLGPPPPVADVTDEGVVLALAQALWIDQRYELLADLGIDAFSIDFRAPDAPHRVNTWAAENTRGMIPHVIDSFDPDEVFALADAAYFDGAWTVPFEAGETRPQRFTRLDGGQVRVPMMHADTHADYYEDDEVQAVRLPYGNEGDIRFIAVIAREGLEPPTLTDWGALETRSCPGTIALPRFRAESELELRDPLTALGLGPMFEVGSDFDGLISGGEPKALGRVLHRARVDVDEQGTRAAAVTVLTGIATAYRPQTPFELRFDRPFLWAIEDRRTDTLLFMGIVTDPSQTAEEST